MLNSFRMLTYWLFFSFFFLLSQLWRALLAALFVQGFCFPSVFLPSELWPPGWLQSWMMTFRKRECVYAQLTGLDRNACLHCDFTGNMALQSDILSQFLDPHNSSVRRSHTHLQDHIPAGRERAGGTWRLCFNWTGKSNKSTRRHLKSYSPIHFTVTGGITQGQWDVALTLKVIDFQVPLHTGPELLARSPTKITWT